MEYDLGGYTGHSESIVQSGKTEFMPTESRSLLHVISITRAVGGVTRLACVAYNISIQSWTALF